MSNRIWLQTDHEPPTLHHIAWNVLPWSAGGSLFFWAGAIPEGQSPGMDAGCHSRRHLANGDHVLTTDELIAYIEQTADPALAADWDQSGLQVAGDTESIQRLALALDPGPETIRPALAWQADFILTHHPLALSPKFPNRHGPLHTVYSLLFRAGTSLYAAHTSLDVQTTGPVSWLAQALGLEAVRPVLPVEPPAEVCLCFPATGVDPDALKRLSTHPACLSATVLESECRLRVQESRVPELLRTIAACTSLDRVCSERSVPLYADHGYGLIGHLPAALAWRDFSIALAGSLGRRTWTRTGSIPERVRTVAYCPGSGMDLAPKAFAQGADIYISGDLKFHQAQDIESLGLTLDVGHFALEEIMMSVWAKTLEQELGPHGVDVAFFPGRDPLVPERCDWDRPGTDAAP